MKMPDRDSTIAAIQEITDPDSYSTPDEVVFECKEVPGLGLVAYIPDETIITAWPESPHVFIPFTSVKNDSSEIERVLSGLLIIPSDVVELERHRLQMALSYLTDFRESLAAHREQVVMEYCRKKIGGGGVRTAVQRVHPLAAARTGLAEAARAYFAVNVDEATFAANVNKFSEELLSGKTSHLPHKH